MPSDLARARLRQPVQDRARPRKAARLPLGPAHGYCVLTVFTCRHPRPRKRRRARPRKRHNCIHQGCEAAFVEPVSAAGSFGALICGPPLRTASPTNSLTMSGRGREARGWARGAPAVTAKSSATTSRASLRARLAVLCGRALQRACVGAAVALSFQSTNATVSCKCRIRIHDNDWACQNTWA